MPCLECEAIGEKNCSEHCGTVSGVYTEKLQELSEEILRLWVRSIRTNGTGKLLEHDTEGFTRDLSVLIAAERKLAAEQVFDMMLELNTTHSKEPFIKHRKRVMLKLFP